ncbi:hypothetical protein Nmel_005752, partial [Mimus melanotis]
MPGAPASIAAAQDALGQNLCSLFQSCSLSDDDEPSPFDRKGLATSSRLRPASPQRSKLWTLPLCQVTVRPKDHYSFWEAVKVKALKQGDWDLLERLGMPQASEGIWMPRAKVFIRDFATNKWEGLHDLIVWGRGYACVSTDTGLRWLPARCVRPDLRRPRQNMANAKPSNTDQHADQQPDGPSTSQ